MSKKGVMRLPWGGVRVIYYWAVARDQILMLFLYPKIEQDDLSPVQIKALRAIVEESYL